MGENENSDGKRMKGKCKLPGGEKGYSLWPEEGAAGESGGVA